MADPRQVLWLMFAGVGWTGVSFNGMNEKMKKTNDEVHCGSFSGRTCQASHTLGPPHVSPSPIPPSSELELPTSLWKGEGRTPVVATLIHENPGIPQVTS